MAIEIVRRGSVGIRFRGHQRGHLFALLPEPVDADTCLADAGFTAFADFDEAWDQEFRALVSALVHALERRFGESKVVAPRRRAPASWRERLRLLISSRSANAIRALNPDALSAVAALMRAAHDDSYLEFAAVEFAHRAGDIDTQCDALTFCSDGHPILWVWLAEAHEGDWRRLAEEASGKHACAELTIGWEKLIPARPVLATKLPRVGFHPGDSVSWNDGARQLRFQASLSLSPPEVHLPPATQWSAQAPQWAATLRPTIVKDFRNAGAKVVETDGAPVADG